MLRFLFFILLSPPILIAGFINGSFLQIFIGGMGCLAAAILPICFPR